MNWHVEKKQQISDEIGDGKKTSLAINLKNIDFEIHLDILKYLKSNPRGTFVISNFYQLYNVLTFKWVIAI